MSIIEIKDMEAIISARELTNLKRETNARLSDRRGENGATDIPAGYGFCNGLAHGQAYYDYRDIVKSPTFSRTGGIKYSFGVEFETSSGFLPDKLARDMNLSMVGDKSISGGEYQTSVLQGDAGVRNVERVCRELSKRTLIDDDCGLHVHVGGVDRHTSPVFNRQFSVLAIMLGCQIEQDMYSINPPSRRFDSEYCAGISAFRNINPDNWRRVLCRYTHDLPLYDKENNRSSRLTRWTSGMGRWLNLTNCNSDNSYREGERLETVEIRVFSPSTNYEKVLNYIRISLAFVWFVENRQRMILGGGCTLHRVISEAYSGDIKRDVLRFIQDRKSEFNRVDYKMYEPISDGHNLTRKKKGKNMTDEQYAFDECLELISLANNYGLEGILSIEALQSTGAWDGYKASTRREIREISMPVSSLSDHLMECPIGVEWSDTARAQLKHNRMKINNYRGILEYRMTELRHVLTVIYETYDLMSVVDYVIKKRAFGSKSAQMASNLFSPCLEYTIGVKVPLIRRKITIVGNVIDGEDRRWRDAVRAISEAGIIDVLKSIRHVVSHIVSLKILARQMDVYLDCFRASDNSLSDALTLDCDLFVETQMEKNKKRPYDLLILDPDERPTAH